MENLRVSFEAIAPLFLLILAGLAMRRMRLLPPEMVPRLNNFLFRGIFPVMLFFNLYETELAGAFRPRVIVFGVVGVVTVFLLALAFVVKIEKDNKKRGVMVQAIFRGNFLILGLPIVQSLYGPAETGVTAMVIAFVIPCLNILAVVSLETFHCGRVDVKNLARGVATNPLILAVLVGVLWKLLAIPLPFVIERSVSSLSAIASPLALVTLGASLQVDTLSGNKRNLIVCVVGKLLVVPGIFIPLAARLGFSGPELATMIGVFATPTAVTSYVMADQMGGDSALAGQAVVLSSALSALTVFLWTFGLKQLGFL